MALEINRLTNATLWVEGKTYLGKVEEVNLPNPKYKLAEHKALGMQGVMEYFSGTEKMEMKLKLNAPYKDIMKNLSNPLKRYNVMLRGHLETITNGARVGGVAYVATMRCSPKDFPMGNFKQNDNVELEMNFTVFAVKLEIGGEKIYELDQEANVMIVGGEDVFAQFRSNLGI